MESKPTKEEIGAQLERLKRSEAFSGSEKLVRLLEFLVSETLDGNARFLKEVVVGNAIYGREPPYDPRIDSTVRVEVRRLRRKLAVYFDSAGQNDPVRIEIPVGSYIPRFRAAKADKQEAAAQRLSGGDIFRPGGGALVAMLPMQGKAGPEDQRAADLLTDELIQRLTSERGYRIISTAAVRQHQEAGTPIAELAIQLGADCILGGTVSVRDSRLVVAIEYVDKTGFVCVTDRLETSAGDLKRAIAKCAATMLSRVRLDSSRMKAMEIGATPGAVVALGQIYRARRFLDRQTVESIQSALQIFEDVRRKARDYARPYSGIADCYCDLFRLGAIDRSAALARARPAVEKAIEIDPGSIEAHTSLATILAWLERNTDAADGQFRKALGLGRNARTLRLYGIFQAIHGEAANAEFLIRNARMEEPLSEQQDIAEAVWLYQARRYEQLLGWYHSDQDGPLPGEALFYTALAANFAGKTEEAAEIVLELDAMCLNQPDLRYASIELDARLGKPERAVDAIRTGVQGASLFAQATLSMAVGAIENAMELLGRAARAAELSVCWLPSDQRFDCLRGSENFKGLLALLSGADAQEAPETDAGNCGASIPGSRDTRDPLLGAGMN